MCFKFFLISQFVFQDFCCDILALVDLTRTKDTTFCFQSFVILNDSFTVHYFLIYYS